MLNKNTFLLFVLVIVLSAAATGCNALPPPAPKPNTEKSKYIALSEQSSNPQNTNSSIYAALQAFQGTAGLYAKNLETGNTITYNQNKFFPTASTNKLIATLAVYKYLYDGATAAEKRDYDRTIKKALTVSDNPSYYHLLNIIEKKRPGALNQVILDLGLKNTTINNPATHSAYGYSSITTPYEMGVALETIYNESYLGPEKSQMVKKLLANTIFYEEIPRHMNTTVMHKIGSLHNSLCDVGIIDDGSNTILLSIYTLTDKSESYASDFIADLSAKTYNALIKKPR